MRAHQKLVEAVALLEEAGSFAGEGAWLGTLAATGNVPPFGARGGMSTAPAGYAEARHAVARLIEGRERQREAVAEYERELVALNSVRPTADAAPRLLEPPPGSHIWTVPGSGRLEPEREAAAVAE